MFDAQTMLEKAQRQEEDQLYSQIETERRALRMRLEECLRSERDRSVKELVKFFEKNGVGQEERQEALVKVGVALSYLILGRTYMYNVRIPL